MKQLPDKWCIRETDDPEENKILADYATKHGAMPPYIYIPGLHPSKVYYHYPAFKDHDDFCTTSSCKEYDYTEISFKDFKHLVLKQMETELLGVPYITGESHHVEAFLQDCIKLGYEKSRYWDSTAGVLRINGNNKDSILCFEDSFKIICGDKIGSKEYSSNIELPICHFNLPQNWSNALEFMKENMRLWNEIQNKPKFKVGDWVLIQGKNYTGKCTGNGISDNYIGQLEFADSRATGNLTGTFMFYHFKNKWLRTEDRFLLRHATPEEIEQAQIRTKIFKMTSSSGDFELEVSKKGIYYRPERRWLGDTFNITNGTAIATISDSGEKSGYGVILSKVDVGCKKDTLVSQWRKVYDYYNLIKEKDADNNKSK